MKKNIKFLSAWVMAICLFFVIHAAVGQTPVVTLDYNGTSLVPGSTITVPLMITGTPASVNISTFTLYVSFDENVLTLTGSTCYVTQAGMNIGWSCTNPASSNTLILGSWAQAAPWYYNTSGNEHFADITFTYNGGTTTLAFNTASCEVTDASYTPYPTVTYVNGSASGSLVTITSVAGGGAWNVGGTWDLLHTPNTSNGTVIINSNLSTPVTISTAISWPHDVKINSDKAMSLNSGSFSTTGTFTIESGGSFIDNTGATISATVKRDMTGNWAGEPTPPSSSTIWHGVSAPVLNPSNSLFNGSLMNKWNEVTQNWDPLTLPYENMPVGKGYIVAPPSGGITATFTGTLNTGDKTISGLTRTGSTGWAGYNLIGNPFSSAIQWNTSILVTNVDNYAWLWNGGAYISKDRTIGDGVVPAEQGFFVHVSTGTGSVTIPNTNRLHSSQAYYKMEITDLLTLKIEGNGYWDQTQIRILPQASETYNSEFDALKLMGSEVAPQLFSYKQDVNLSIISLPTLTVYPIVQIGLKPGAAGNFTITASDFESFGSGADFYLEDLLTAKSQDLKSNPVYEFNAVAGQPEHRFNLHFSTLGIGEKETGNIKIYSNENVVYINITSSMSGDIVVYNLLGCEVARTVIAGNSLNKISLNVPQGYYIVKVNGNTGNGVEKVFIR